MKTKLARTRILALTAALLGGISTAYAVPTTLIYVNSSSGALYSYDSSNAFAETLVSASTGAFSISSGPLGNTIYVQNGGGSLSTYNLLTNTSTFIGGSVPGNSLGEGRDGYLYSGNGPTLYRVDPVTGFSTPVGNGTYGYAGDIAVDPTNLGLMYGAVSAGSGVSLVTIDRTSGAQSIVGSFGAGATSSIFGLGFSLDGTLYATGPTGGGGGIYTVDKSTGLASLVRTVGYQPYDMATQPFEVREPPPTSVPEPASLALFGLGLAGLGFWRRKKSLIA